MKKIRINWEKLRTFYLVACAGAFNKAAALHNKTGPAMSSMIKSFEEELRVKLFLRKETGLELTKEGEQLFAAAQRIFHVVKAEEEVLSKSISSSIGHLRTFASAGLLTRYIGNFIDEFIINNPTINLEFLPTNDLSQQERLNGDVLINTRIDGLTGYRQEHLIDLDLRLYASRAYLEKFGVPKLIEDLDNHQLISFLQNKKYPLDLNWHLLIGRRPKNRRQPFLEVDENFGRCQICSKGTGIISVPKQHPELKKYDLVEVLPQVKGPTTTYYLIVNEHLYQYEKIRLFTTFLKEQFARLQKEATA